MPDREIGPIGPRDRPNRCARSAQSDREIGPIGARDRLNGAAEPNTGPSREAGSPLDRLALRALVRTATDRLAAAGVASPAVDARLLAEHVLGCSLLMADGAPGDFPERYEELVARRATREPLQHVLGVMWFRGLELVARPGVFVVRPETEVVAGAAIDAARAVRPPRRPLVVDLCTGSGAIAAALATEVPGARVYAVELDPTALELAGENLARLAPSATLLAGDATAPLPGLAEVEGCCDVVVSNPPYVPHGAVEDLETELHDPDLALFGGDDGTAVPLAVLERAASLLRLGGVLVMEHDAGQGAVLREAARRMGFAETTTGTDLTGRDRYLWAVR